MQKLGEFKLPAFFNYPHYFTLQPVRETREKQVQLWKELILDYFRTQKIFVIGLEEEFPFIVFTCCKRELALIPIGRKKCILKWRPSGGSLHGNSTRLRCMFEDRECVQAQKVKENGLEDSVMTVEEILSGIESRGTELHGMDRTFLMRALKLVEIMGNLLSSRGLQLMMKA
ncbi:hypothetical protein ACOSQ3_003208 [Xanthoceras sorbifolium]